MFSSFLSCRNRVSGVEKMNKSWLILAVFRDVVWVR